MSGRRLVLIVTGLALAGSMLATGCATSNSATVSSTPSPASTVPFETPTPSPTVTPTGSATTTPGSTPTQSPSSSPTPWPTTSPTPSVLAKPVNTYALVRGLGTTSKGRYTITYDPVVLCTKAAVTVGEAPRQCNAKPAKRAPDGSWTVRTTTVSVIATLAPAVSGTVYPAGVPFAVTPKNLAAQKARNGVLFDWSTISVRAVLTVAKNEITTVAGSRSTS